MKDHLVLLTCNVKTQMRHDLKRSNPDTRLADYVMAIRKWNKLSRENGFKLLVVENSGSIESIKNLLTSQERAHITFYSAMPDYISHLHGISAGEYALLQEIAKSELISREVKYIWKITGRLYVSNFTRIAKLSSGCLVINRLYAWKHLIDTRIIGFKPEIFKRLFETNQFFGESGMNNSNDQREKSSTFISLEHYIAFQALNLEINDFNVETMPAIPIFYGISASTNKQIDNTRSRFKKRMANRFRRITFKLLVGSSP